MALFKTKPEVKLELSPEAGFVLGYTYACWTESAFGDFVVTSAKDGQHMVGSKHATGEAFDIRTRKHFNEHEGHHAPIMVAFCADLKRNLQPHGVDVVLHPDDDPPGKKLPPHLHMEYDPKPGRVLTEVLT